VWWVGEKLKVGNKGSASRGVENSGVLSIRVQSSLAIHRIHVNAEILTSSTVKGKQFFCPSTKNLVLDYFIYPPINDGRETLIYEWPIVNDGDTL
jgi:hypothetical protein